MGYYRRQMGDYSTGGYGQMGDPGLLSFIGKVGKSIWKVAKPVIGAALGIPIVPAVVGGLAGAAAGTAIVPYGGAPPPPPWGNPRRCRAIRRERDRSLRCDQAGGHGRALPVRLPPRQGWLGAVRKESPDECRQSSSAAQVAAAG